MKLPGHPCIYIPLFHVLAHFLGYSTFKDAPVDKYGFSLNIKNRYFLNIKNRYFNIFLQENSRTCKMFNTISNTVCFPRKYLPYEQTGHLNNQSIEIELCPCLGNYVIGAIVLLMKIALTSKHSIESGFINPGFINPFCDMWTFQWIIMDESISKGLFSSPEPKAHR